MSGDFIYFGNEASPIEAPGPMAYRWKAGKKDVHCKTFAKQYGLEPYEVHTGQSGQHRNPFCFRRLSELKALFEISRRKNGPAHYLKKFYFKSICAQVCVQICVNH